MLKKGFGNGGANLLMGDARQQIDQIRHPTAHGGDAFGLQLLLIRVEIVRQTAEIGVEQQGAVVKAAIRRFAIG